jgi:hypothetical protein
VTFYLHPEERAHIEGHTPGAFARSRQIKISVIGWMSGETILHSICHNPPDQLPSSPYWEFRSHSGKLRGELDYAVHGMPR